MMEEPDLDLAAWEAPPPPVGLADAVVARLNAQPAAELDDHAGRALWRRLGIAGVIVAAAAVVAIVMLGGKRATPRSGEITAVRSQRIDLDGASAELDAGTELTWLRGSSGLRVTQTRGGAQWHVGDQPLEIDAASASIIATGASLRVEVHMTAADARVIGASSVTAAVVAFATVVVYDGHVRATSGGTTVDVLPGAVVELRSGQPPGPPAPPPHEALAVGAAPVDTTAAMDAPAPTSTVTPKLSDADKNVAAVDTVREQLVACAVEWRQVGTFELSMTHQNVDPFSSFSGGIVELKLSYRAIDASGHTVPSRESSMFRKCLQDALPELPTRAEFSYRLSAPAPDSGSTSHPKQPQAAACDTEALRQAGRQAWTAGDFALAVSSLEKAYACTPDAGDLTLIAAGACKLKDAAKARRLFPRIPAAARLAIAQACLEHGIQLE